MKITRKGFYTIIGPDGLPLLKADGSLRRVTSRDECYEWITEDGREGVFTISCPDREVLRTKLSSGVVLPIASSFKLNATAYQVDAGDTIQFTIIRGGDTSQIIQVEWVITGATVSQQDGTERFLAEETQRIVTVTASSPAAQENGTLTLAVPLAIGPTAITPSLTTPFSASFVVLFSGSNPQDILFPEWPYDHRLESLGAAPDIPGTWGISTNPDNATANTFWEIRDSDPLISDPGTAKQYFHTQLTGLQQPPNYRSERSEQGHLRNGGPRANMVSVGGGLFAAEEEYWYGFLMRIDRADSTNAGYYCQWHTRLFLGNSPPLAIRASNRMGQGGLNIYLESNRENAGNDINSDHVLLFPALLGQVHSHIIHVFWDERTLAEGSQGFMRWYIDDNAIPVFEHLGSNIQDTDPGEMELPYFKYGLYKSSLDNGEHDGEVHIQGYDMFTEMGEGGSRLGMLDALRFSDII